MSAAFYTNGNSTVYSNGSLLGLSKDPIAVEPVFHFTDVQADDFGPKAPAAILWDLAEVLVRMTLVYFDNSILQEAVKASMGGGTLGTLQGAGAIIGGFPMQIESGSVPGGSWTFPTAFLAERPLTFPLGNEYSAVQLTWRAVGLPTAAAEVLSQGTVLWNHD